MMNRLASFALLWLVVGCGSSHGAPRASDYDRSCTSVADCTAVYIGGLGCCGSPCPNTAVRATVAQKAMDDVEAARVCKAAIPCPFNPNDICQGGRVLCTAGQCMLESLPDAGGTP